MSCGGDMWLSNIPRYANFTQHYVSARSINTVSIHWEADSSINAWQHSINGGGWQDCNGGNTYVISNLSPNTTYYIRTRIRRSDSGLWTESGNISATTYDIAKLSSTDNILILSNKLNYTYINAAGAKVELGIFKTDGKTAIINYKEYKNAIGTISFTESEIDTIYKMMKNNNDFTVRLYIRSTQNGLSYLNYKDVKIKINRCFKTCISASWR